MENQVPLTSEGENAANVLSLINQNPALLNDPVLKEFHEFAKNVKPEEPVKEEEKEEKEEKVSSDPEYLTEKPKDIFTVDLPRYAFTEFDQIQQHVQKKFGVKDVQGWNKLMTNVDKWRNDAQESVDVTEELNSIKETLQALPPEIAQSLTLWSKGQDYTQPFINGKPRMDYSKPFDHYDKQTIIKAYFPEQSQQEDWDEFVDTPQFKALYSTARTLYDKDVQLVMDERDRINRKHEELKERLTSTGSVSVNALKQSFPNEDIKKIRKIENLLKEGDDQAILGLFRNRDGSYKKEAAVRLFHALFGQEALEDARSLINEQNKSIYPAVEKGKRTPEPGTSAQTGKPANSPLINSLGDFVRPNTY